LSVPKICSILQWVQKCEWFEFAHHLEPAEVFNIIMNQTTEKTQIKDLPDEIIGRVQREIEPYEVILLDPNMTKGKVPPLASGTLVQIGEKYCILTAKHVTNELKELKEIGLNLGTFEHRFTIDTLLLRILEVDEPSHGATSSGLAIIILPVSKIGIIKAKKIYWNLTKHMQSVLSKPIDWKIGLFFVCGTIGEWSKIEDSLGWFSKTLNCQCEFMYTGCKKYYLKGEFDYLELSVSYKKRNDLPNSFRGASGGGIWGTQLFRTDDGRINYSSPLLVGMACEEDVKTNGSRSIIAGITGYGWRSIYEQVISKVGLLNKR